MVAPNRVQFVLKSEGRQSRLDSIEKGAKIASLIAIPLIVSIAGLVLSAKLESTKSAQEYTELAVTILKEPIGEDSEAKQGMREWAVQLLEKSSPVSPSKELKQSLVTGSVKLPKTGDGLRLSDTEMWREHLDRFNFATNIYFLGDVHEHLQRLGVNDSLLSLHFESMEKDLEGSGHPIAAEVVLNAYAPEIWSRFASLEAEHRNALTQAFVLSFAERLQDMNKQNN